MRPRAACSAPECPQQRIRLWLDERNRRSPARADQHLGSRRGKILVGIISVNHCRLIVLPLSWLIMGGKFSLQLGHPVLLILVALLGQAGCSQRSAW